MTAIQHNMSSKQRRSQRVHANIRASAERPKLVITRTNKAIYLQVVDVSGKVILAANDLALAKEKSAKTKKTLTKTERASEVGALLAGQLQKAKIKTLAVDRGANKFHGRIKAAVEAVRAAGVEV